MKTRIVTEPRFVAETTALLARLGAASPIGPASSISDYQALLAARAEPADPATAGHPDPAQQRQQIGSERLDGAGVQLVGHEPPPARRASQAGRCQRPQVPVDQRRVDMPQRGDLLIADSPGVMARGKEHHSLGGTQADEGDQQSAGEHRRESCPDAGLAPPVGTASLARS
jgi:hypothetical protein